MRYFLLLFLTSICINCRNPQNKIYQFKDLIEIKKIKLIEREFPIGIISSVTITADKKIYLLDISASDVKFYDFEGNFLNRIGGKGKGPNQLLTPRSLYVNENQIVVGDVGFYATKCFNRNGELIRMIRVDKHRPVFGDIQILKNDKILHTGLWDGDFEVNGKPIAFLIDTSGTILERIGQFPIEYQENNRLGGTTYMDMNTNGKFALTLEQSSSLFIGDIEKNELIEYSLKEKRARYQNEDLKQSNLTIEKLNEINLLIYYNTCMRFLNDSVIVRSYAKHTKQTLEEGAFVNAINFCEFYNLKGEFLGEKQVKGVLRATYDNQLIVEENDEPDKRIFTFYKVEYEFKSI